MKNIVAGTRGSKLAVVQTTSIANALDCEVEIRRIKTRGDKIQDVALAKVEGKAFFTKEIDEALLREEVDFAVHSFKDVPTDLPEGIIIAAVPERESPRDALVGPYNGFDELPRRALIGTSSLRRRAQVLHARLDAVVEDLRGNIDTRMSKISQGKYDAIVVAEAGLRRLGYEDYIPLEPESFIPAAGQGALAVTARADDTEVLELLSRLEHPHTRLLCDCERLFLSTLEGGCQVPAGVYTRIDEASNEFQISGFISSVDGKRFIRADDSATLESAERITQELATALLNSGGREILSEIRREVA